MIILVPILLVLLGVLMVTLGVTPLRVIWRRLRTPPELRGDWWPRFEHEFRAYAEHASKPTRDTRPRAHDRTSLPDQPPGTDS